jgi:hypothetical protein
MRTDLREKCMRLSILLDSFTSSASSIIVGRRWMGSSKHSARAPSLLEDARGFDAHHGAETRASRQQRARKIA